MGCEFRVEVGDSDCGVGGIGFEDWGPRFRVMVVWGWGGWSASTGVVTIELIKFHLIPNYSPGKSEVLLFFNGPGPQAQERYLAIHEINRIPFSGVGGSLHHSLPGCMRAFYGFWGWSPHSKAGGFFMGGDHIMASLRAYPPDDPCQGSVPSGAFL